MNLLKQLIFPNNLGNQQNELYQPYCPDSIVQDYGNDFVWGVAMAAAQVEGAANIEGRESSIWDDFSSRKGKIKDNAVPTIACDFYHRYKEDLALMAGLGIKNFRTSISWSRVLPSGIGAINTKGLDFYDRLVDEALFNGITPWLTLYHWDLPSALQKQGGWVNRDVLNWFEQYINAVVPRLQDRVKHWMILNEPMVFTGAGYFLGVHAPGERGFKNFLPAVHHAALSIGQGYRQIKAINPALVVGSTFSCSHVTPNRNKEKDIAACSRADALLNRLFIEPINGLGYPVQELKQLSRIEKYAKSSDWDNLPVALDFHGIQVYTREEIKYSWFTPYLQARIVEAKSRVAHITQMGWEVHPASIYEMLKKFASYPLVKQLIITENGAAFDDDTEDEVIHDVHRLTYLKHHIGEVLKAKHEGVPVSGYFVWTWMDNFEWAEGYHPRFGLVHVDNKSLHRRVKNSGYWYGSFLKGQASLQE